MNIEEIKLERKEVSYSDLISAVTFAVNSSFGATDGKYHKYLQDYGETLALLITFTNYSVEAENEVDLFDQIMNIACSEKWKKEFIPELGETYNMFIEYVDAEIDYKIRPFAKFDMVFDAASVVLDKAAQIASAIDVEKLKDYDFTSLLNAISSLETDTKTNEEIEHKDDNIVELQK